MTENYKRMMDSFVLSEAFREDTEKKIAKVEASAPRRRMKAMRIALIAAALCVLMAAGVTAAGMLTNSGEFTAGKNYVYEENGWERLPHTLNFGESILHPLDELSENARAMLEQKDSTPLFFDSIYDAGEYFGVEILNNSIMENEAYHNSYPFSMSEDPDTVLGSPHCFALPGSETEDGYGYVKMAADYAHESWEGNKLYVSVYLFSEHHDAELEFNSMFRTDYTENYRSPNGLEATIVQSDFFYYAYFSCNGMVYELMVWPDGGMGGERTLSLLKDILEAFEFEQRR